MNEKQSTIPLVGHCFDHDMSTYGKTYSYFTAQQLTFKTLFWIILVIHVYPYVNPANVGRSKSLVSMKKIAYELIKNLHPVL